MNRNICICLDFLTEAHKAQIEAAASAAGFTPHFFTQAQFDEAVACAQTCEIIYAKSPDLLRAAPASLKWFCCSNAGVDPFCADESLFANPDCILTNSNGYGVTIAEHVIMVTLMLMRRIPEYTEIVHNRGWQNQLSIRSIRGTNFTVLGTGNIGLNVAERLRGMNAGRITGLSRSGRAVEGFDKVLPISALDEVLPNTEVLIMALPGTAETTHILNADRIALLPENALVINVGRGSAIEQESLMEALNTGKIAGAALDVMTPEPLPHDHPLWETKNLIITPHVSGNMTLGYTCDINVEMFCTDLANYAAGRPLNGFVDRKLGY